MRNLFVINPRSFKGETEIHAFKNEVKRHFGATKKFEIIISRYPRDAVCCVHRYLDKYDGEVRVYAVGGDGILYDCLNGMAGFPAAELTCFPCGVSDTFVRAFGENATASFCNIEALLSAPTIQTDVINFGDGYALNYCAFGLPATITLSNMGILNNLISRRGKRYISAAFTLKSFLSVFNRSVISQPYDIMLDDRSFSGKYASIIVSNGPCFGNDKTVSPHALPNDGLLDVMLIRNVHTLKLLAMLPNYLKGKYHKHLDCIAYVKASRVEISSSLPIYFSADGEPSIATSVALKIVPGAIKFAAPSGLTYEGGRNGRERVQPSKR